MTQYLATFHGASYAGGSIHEHADVEVLWSLDHATNTLRERYQTGGFYPIRIRGLDGHTREVLMPNVEVGDELALYAITGEQTSPLAAWHELLAYPDPYPTHIVRVGPRGGVKIIHP